MWSLSRDKSNVFIIIHVYIIIVYIVLFMISHYGNYSQCTCSFHYKGALIVAIKNNISGFPSINTALSRVKKLFF